MLAHSMALLANINRGQGMQPFTLEDFMPDYLRAPERPLVQTPEEQMARLEAMTRQRGGEVSEEELSDEAVEALLLRGFIDPDDSMARENEDE